MLDLASRLDNRLQLTTDGHKDYLTAVENAFGSEIDYAMLVKIYGGTTTRISTNTALLNAPEQSLCRSGDADEKHIQQAMMSARI